MRPAPDPSGSSSAPDRTGWPNGSPDRHIRLDRFDGYVSRTEAPEGNTGRKFAYLDSIFFVPVSDLAVRIAGTRRGDFQFAEQIPSDQHEQLRSDSNLVPYVATLPFWNAAIFNNRQGLMANPKIRQAFLAAIDDEPVMRAAFGPTQFWRLDAGVMPKEHPMYTDAGKEFYNQKNPSKARALLQEAGYRGEPVRWMTTTEFPHQAVSAQVVKPMLERAGFVVDLQVSDWATVVGRRVRPELWEVFSTQIAFFPDPVFQVPLQHTWPGWWSHRDGMAMMELLRRHTNPQTRSTSGSGSSGPGTPTRDRSSLATTSRCICTGASCGDSSRIPRTRGTMPGWTARPDMHQDRGRRCAALGRRTIMKRGGQATRGFA